MVLHADQGLGRLDRLRQGHRAEWEAVEGLEGLEGLVETLEQRRHGQQGLQKLGQGRQPPQESPEGELASLEES